MKIKKQRQKQKEHLAFIIGGASIILLTFLVRDLLLDDARNERDGATNQREMLQVRSDIFQLRFIKSNESTPEAEVFLEKANYYGQFVPDKIVTSNDFTLFFAEFLPEGAQSLADERDAIYDIINIIGKSDTNCAKILYKESIAYEHAETNDWSSVLLLVYKNPTHNFAILNKYFYRKYSRRHALDKAIFIVKEYVVRNLELSEDNAEHRYRLTNYASYIMFSIGWVFAFVGRLHGIDSDDECE